MPYQKATQDQIKQRRRLREIANKVFNAAASLDLSDEVADTLRQSGHAVLCDFPVDYDIVVLNRADHFRAAHAAINKLNEKIVKFPDSATSKDYEQAWKVEREGTLVDEDREHAALNFNVIYNGNINFTNLHRAHDDDFQGCVELHITWYHDFAAIAWSERIRHGSAYVTRYHAADLLYHPSEVLAHLDNLNNRESIYEK